MCTCCNDSGGTLCEPTLDHHHDTDKTSKFLVVQNVAICLRLVEQRVQEYDHSVEFNVLVHHLTAIILVREREVHVCR